MFVTAIPVAVAVILTQRPRPSYLFSLSVLGLAVTGMAISVLLRRWPRFAPAAIAMLVAAYWIGPRDAHGSMAPSINRDLRTHVSILLPYAEHFRRPNTRILVGQFLLETCNYLGQNICRAVNPSILDDWPQGMPLEQFLEREKINLVFLRDWLLDHVEQTRPDDARAFLSDPPAPGWKLLGTEYSSRSRWRLYVRDSTPPQSK